MQEKDPKIQWYFQETMKKITGSDFSSFLHKKTWLTPFPSNYIEYFSKNKSKKIKDSEVNSLGGQN